MLISLIVGFIFVVGLVGSTHKMLLFAQGRGLICLPFSALGVWSVESA